MASDNHAHYARIGFTVIIGVVAIVATLVYLGGVRDRDSEFLIETYYDNPVSGLSVGSPVNLFGVKIGEVREISFADDTYDGKGASEEDIQRVCIVMAIDKRTFGFRNDDDEDLILDCLNDHVRRGVRATLSSNAVTGLARIELNIAENPPPVAQLGWVPRYPLVPPSPSLLENFSSAATKLVNKLKTMDFDAVWSNMNQTAEAAARTAENADALLQSSRAGVRQIVSDVGGASSEFRELSTTLRSNPSLVLRPTDPEPLPETAR